LRGARALTHRHPFAGRALRSSTLGWVEHVNLTDGAMVRQMFPVLLTFYGSVYSNMKARLWHARSAQTLSA